MSAHASAPRELLRGVRVAPSILSADFGRLREQVGEVLDAGRAGDPRRRDGRPLRAADHASGRWSWRRSPATVREAGAMLEVHLMIERPERHVGEFVKAGADSVTFHAEATPHVAYTANLIRERGACVGVAINPGDARRGAGGGRATRSTWRCA